MDKNDKKNKHKADFYNGHNDQNVRRAITGTTPTFAPQKKRQDIFLVPTDEISRQALHA